MDALSEIFVNIEKMKRTLGDAPPAPFFASYRLLMPDRAVQFVHDGRIHLGAHPEFWWRMKPKQPQAVRLPPLFGIDIVDLDSDELRRQAFVVAMLSALGAES